MEILLEYQTLNLNGQGNMNKEKIISLLKKYNFDK